MKEIDALILGCTHYPLFTDILKQELPNVELINTGTMIANMLYDENEDIGKVGEYQDIIYLTDDNTNFMDIICKKLDIDNFRVEII